MTKVKDRFGIELNVGDKALYTSSYSHPVFERVSETALVEIVKFGEKVVVSLFSVDKTKHLFLTESSNLRFLSSKVE